MSKWNHVNKERREQIFAYNRRRAADSQAARDMHTLAGFMAKLPKGQLKQLLSGEVTALLAKYGVEVLP